jgi:hypothetical protein
VLPEAVMEVRADPLLLGVRHAQQPTLVRPQ